MALYDAFISYSHAQDKPIAAALQAAIQKLGRPWYRRRVLRLFRDDTSLSATPHLWPTIEQALSQSRFFLLLASPEAAASKWVNKEVGYWIEHNSIDALLIGLTDGELIWDDAVGDFSQRESFPLPQILAKKFTSEPKWVDLRPFRASVDGAASKGDAKFTELAADFAAAIRSMPKEDLLSQEVLQQRRALRLAVAAAALLLVLAIVATATGIMAFREQQEAIAQRKRAEDTLAAATETANRLVFDLAQRFQDAMGVPAALVKDILDRARALQEQLIKSGQVTPELKRSESAALNETVNTLLAIGDTKGALAAAEEALKIDADLLAGNPAKTDYQRNLSVSYNGVGDVRKAQGDLTGALKSYRDSLAIRQPLARSDPGNASWQRDLSASYDRIGDVRVAQGDLDGALKSYRDSLAIRERLAQSNLANAGWQRDLSVSYNKVGDAQLAQGDFTSALKFYRDSLAITARLAQSDPGNAGSQRDLSVSYEKVGNVQKEQRGFTGALKSYQDSLAIVERLAQSDASNAGWQRDLVVSYRNVGDVQKEQRDFTGALISYRDSLDITKRLAQSDANNAGWQRDLAVLYSRMGDVQKEQRDFTGALISYRDSLDITERLAQSDASNTEWQRDLAMLYNRTGDVQREQNDLVGALKCYRQGLPIVQHLASLGGANKQAQDDLQFFINRIGGLAYNLVLARNFEVALEASDQAISLAPDKIWIYSNRAHALMFLDRTEEARIIYLKYRDQADVQDGKSWKTYVLADFIELRKAGLSNPLMNEIERLFTSAG
jgi:tetratricopeptide (TPR) repeat protein